MIQEFSYTLQEYRLDYFYTQGPKYDRRIAVCVGPQGMQDIPTSYGQSQRGPEAVISYKNHAKLSVYLQKLTNYSKLLLVGHGGVTALREKSSREAPPIKPDFSVKMAAELFSKQAPQLRDPEGEAPSQLFRISLVSCKALRYGLDLSIALAKQGISNQVTARTLEVQFGFDGTKETIDPKKSIKHKFTGSKLLITTYAQCPSLSQMEFVNYEEGPTNQFVWVPGSVKPLQLVRLPDQSLIAYESLFRALHMIGMTSPPLSLLHDALENTTEKETLAFLASVYFPKTAFGTDQLQIFLEYALTNSLAPDRLSLILKETLASLPATLDTWVKFALDHSTHPKTLHALLRNTRSPEGRSLYLQTDTLAYAIEKDVSTSTRQDLLLSLSPSALSSLAVSGLKKGYRPDVQLLIFQERAAATISTDSSGFDPNAVADELLEQIVDKKLSTSFLEALLPYLHPIEVSKVIERAILRGIEDTQLELFFNTKQNIKFNAMILLKTNSPRLQKLLLPHIRELPQCIRTRALILKRYPELKNLLKKRCPDLHKLVQKKSGVKYGLNFRSIKTSIDFS